MKLCRIITGDVIDELANLESESVQCVVTSPPYWGLRDYGEPGQIGLEKTPEEYAAKLVGVFRQIHRVLRDDGTVWLNLGDTYASTTAGAGGDGKQHTNAGSVLDNRSRRIPDGLKPKDLTGIPWRVAFALQADGWYLRSDIIWAKPNPMPESVTDRPTKAHEYIFLLTKQARYYWDADAIKEGGTSVAGSRAGYAGYSARAAAMGREASGNEKPGMEAFNNGTRNIRTVWDIPTQPYPEAHFATFPMEIPLRCIKAGTSEKGCCPDCGTPWGRRIKKLGYTKADEPISRMAGSPHGESNQLMENGGGSWPVQTIGWMPGCKCGRAGTPTRPCTVLDPFCGSGTTGSAALQLGRKFVGIELNPEYAALAKRRIGRAINQGTYREDKSVDSPLFEGSINQR